jgi:hypothetical protein
VLFAGVGALQDAMRWRLETKGTETSVALARSVDRLMLSDSGCGAWTMAHAAELASR